VDRAEADRAEAACSGFYWECSRTALEGVREAAREAGAAEASAEAEAVMVADLGDLAAAAAEAEALQETGSAE